MPTNFVVHQHGHQTRWWQKDRQLRGLVALMVSDKFLALEMNKFPSAPNPQIFTNQIFPCGKSLPKSSSRFSSLIVESIKNEKFHGRDKPRCAGIHFWILPVRSAAEIEPWNRPISTAHLPKHILPIGKISFIAIKFIKMSSLWLRFRIDRRIWSLKICLKTWLILVSTCCS